MAITPWGIQKVGEHWRGECRYGNPEVLGDGTLVFPTPGHPPIDGFERQEDDITFIPKWPECVYAFNSIGLRSKWKIVARRNCMHPDHPLYKKMVRFGDCNNCKICVLLKDWEDPEDN